MAGDWIKMRGELLTHPRFLALCSALIYGESHGLLIYVCGEDALEIGVMPPSNKSVTELALRCVTETALRDVTLASLLRVWCAVNSHCKVSEQDAIMNPMTVTDLDRIAGFGGFGEAMSEVGWVSEHSKNSLIFPNFLEFNEPACLRPKAKSNAERQRDFRAKQARNGTVTKCNGSNDRVEKSRVESLVGRKEGKAKQFAFLKDVETDHLKHASTVCGIHRTANRESPDLFPADEPTLLGFVGAAVRALDRPDKQLDTFCGIVRHRNWESVVNGDQKKRARSMLQQHREYLTRCEKPDRAIIPLCDERKDS